MPPMAWTPCSPLTSTAGAASSDWAIPDGGIQILPWTLVGLDLKAAAEPQPLVGGDGDAACFELALIVHDYATSMGSADEQFKAFELAECLEDMGYPPLRALTQVYLVDLIDILDGVLLVCPAHEMEKLGDLQTELEDAVALL
jgi:hypothetical protein